MKLSITNTLSGKKELFTPIKKNEVSIYVCGVTLYDDIHIGHLKSILSFEVMRNYFISQNYRVNFVRNITDIDDKIINKAKTIGVSPLDLVETYIHKFHDLLEKLDITPPDNEPRVTQYLEKIGNYIEDLKKKEMAYEVEDGIYFDTQKTIIEKYPLSKKIVKDLESVSRISQEMHYKRHKADFALWKKDIEHGYHSDVFHDKGRPGWHIECSVMHYHTLGDKFDIHGGGRDLIFPHHENEILQSVAHNGHNPANYWVHNGMMTKNGQKLSKSLGNSIYVKDMLKEYSAEALKLFLNKGQYNQSQEFNIDELKEAQIRWDSFVENIPLYTEKGNIENDFYATAISYLEDDFNTPKVVALFYALLKEINKTNDKNLAQTALKIAQLLSIVSKDNSLENIYDKWKENQKIPEEIVQLLQQRAIAKAQKNYLLSDSLRNEIASKGWELKDDKEGYKIKRKI